MNIPQNLKYSNDHEWLRIEGNIGYVGITDYAQNQLGDIVFVEVTSVGIKLKQGDVFGSIEAVKTVSDLMIPVGAEVLELNKKLEDAPELINTDPYNEGWIVKIAISDIIEVSSLFDSEQYKQLFE